MELYIVTNENRKDCFYTTSKLNALRKAFIWSGSYKDTDSLSFDGLSDADKKEYENHAFSGYAKVRILTGKSLDENDNSKDLSKILKDNRINTKEELETVIERSKSPVDAFLEDEINFRLKEFFNTNPTEELRDEILNKLDNSESFIDTEVIDDVIREVL